MMRTSLRFITGGLAALVMLGMVWAALPVRGNAAVTPSPSSSSSTVSVAFTAGNVKLTKPSRLTTNSVTSGVEITFQFYTDGSPTVNTGSNISFFISGSSPFSWDSKTTLAISQPSSGAYTYTGTFKNLTYNGSSGTSMTVILVGTDDGTDDAKEIEINVPIPSNFFRVSSSSEDEEETAPTSDIVVETVTCTSTTGQKLDKIDKDTGPFNVEIVYSDIGLQDQGFNEIAAGDLHAFLTTATGFKLPTGSVGTLSIVSVSGVYPRFKAVFTNVEYAGGGKDLGFRVQYDFDAYYVKGTSTAALYQIATDEEEEEDDGELPPVKPKIVIDEYSYGDDPIVAGNEFTLDIKFRNTSSEIAVEGVTMTLTPSEGLAITEASNTMYIPNMKAGESMEHSIALRTLPSLAAGSVKLDIKFNYQYIMNKKERPEGESSESISVPITQLDRFAVDPITDYTQYLQTGEEGYLSVPLINRGNATTKNISAFVRAEGDFLAPASHFGNLESGKNGTVDVNITINKPGEFRGEVVVQYEDENLQQKELAVPFSIMVDDPYVEPPPFDPEQGMAAESPAWQKWFRIGLCVLGGLLLAAPLALYLIKRVKAKGSVEIDEDF